MTAGARAARLVDVARLAGVSPMTVSNVINDRVGFTEETRRRVLDAIAETGYQPNRAAQHLRTRRARRVGFHLIGEQLDIRNPFALSLLRPLVRAADARNYRVTVMAHPVASPDEFRNDATARDVDGFILSDCDLGDYRVEILSELQVPFVVMGRTLPDQPQTWVDIDNRVAIEEMVDLLVDRGHKSFSYLGYADDHYWAVERRDGVQARLAHHGLRLPESRILKATQDQLAPLLHEIIGSEARPSVLVTGSDSIAVVAVTIAQSYGLVVGRDIAVTGFDGCSLESIVDPPLTTVQIPVPEIAEALIDRFVREMDGPTHDAGTLVPTRILQGASA